MVDGGQVILIVQLLLKYCFVTHLRVLYKHIIARNILKRIFNFNIEIQSYILYNIISF